MKLKTIRNEGAGTYDSKREIKVRKDHPCQLCQGMIEKGETALVHSTRNGAFSVNRYYCGNCYEIVEPIK